MPQSQPNPFSDQGVYVASPELQRAVRAALILEKPLLVRGEPGTGKTTLAMAIAEGLKRDLLIWNIKSTTKAQEGLYTYDAVRRLNDSRFGGEDVHDIAKYISLGVLGRAFRSEQPTVVLIDEIDKADIEFPNDLLNELDRMEFAVSETGELVKARHRPLMIITSNAEKELPDAFLRRCLFHFIAFPQPDQMQIIVRRHFPQLETSLLSDALEVFYNLRQQYGIKKKPSSSELLDWIRILVSEGFTSVEKSGVPPFTEALLKREEDYLKMLDR